jgi:hypothetical protein
MLIAIDQVGLFCRVRVWIFGAPVGKFAFFFGQS